MMRAFMLIAEQFLVDRLLSNGAPLSGKSKAGFGLMAFSGLFLIVGVLFMLYAAFIYLDATYSKDMAAFIMGGILMGLAGLTALVSYGVLRYKQRKIRQFKQETIETVEQSLGHVMGILDKELSAPVKDNPKLAIFIATAAGFLAGDKCLHKFSK